ncbi:MAG: hypothetical protein QX189_12760 [Methylococcales bacterium]
MGQAKQRGTEAERIADAMIEANKQALLRDRGFLDYNKSLTPADKLRLHNQRMLVAFTLGQLYGSGIH